MVLCVDEKDVDTCLKAIEASGDKGYVVGHIEEGQKGVKLC